MGITGITFAGMMSYGHFSSNQTQLSDLTLHNIEALSQGENFYEIVCLGTGSLDCPGSETKVREVHGRRK